jgi:hypothetical protein
MGCKTGECRNVERACRPSVGHHMRRPCPFEDGVSPFYKTDRRPVSAHFHDYVRWTGKGPDGVLEMAQAWENIHFSGGLWDQ